MNSINNLLLTLFINQILDIDFRDYFICTFDFIDSSIYQIIIICDTEPNCKCTCNCKCEPSSNGKFVCICLCKGAKAASSNGFCICVCKNQSKNCICICICNKSEKCCCEEKKAHTCESCLVQVDIGSLKLQSFTIVNLLSWIRCCISRLENQNSNVCCCCDCVTGQCKPELCQTYCCCKEGQISYPSILSKLYWIEYNFKLISQKIPELINLKNTLYLISSIETSCKKIPGCSCKDKIDTLINNIERALYYYNLFDSRINEIGPFVVYKFFYPKSKEIICSFQKGIKCLLESNKKIMIEIVNPNYTKLSTKLLMGVYSHHSIFQSYVGINLSILSSSKLHPLLDIIELVKDCECVGEFKKRNNNIKFLTSNFYEYLLNMSNKNTKDFKNLYIQNASNHFCTCLVMKYLLYPSLLKTMYDMRYFYLEVTSKQTGEFIPKMFNGVQINDFIKLTYLVIILLDKIASWMKRKYYYKWTIDPKRVYINCYCLDSGDPNYNRVVSIIIYLSWLIENIWAKGNSAIVTAIESLSILYYELKIYDFSSMDHKDKLKNIQYLLNFKSYLPNYIKWISDNYKQCHESLMKNIETFKCIKSCVKTMESLVSGIKNSCLISQSSIRFFKCLFSYISYSGNINSTLYYIEYNNPSLKLKEINALINKLKSIDGSNGIPETTKQLKEIKSNLSLFSGHLSNYIRGIRDFIILRLSQLTKIERKISRVHEIFKKYEEIKHQVRNCKSSLEFEVQRLESIKSNAEILEKQLESIIEILENYTLVINELTTIKECQKPCSCLKNKTCKICMCSKISCVTIKITIYVMKYTLAIVIKQIMVDTLKLAEMEKTQFVRNSFINGNLELVKTLKNNYSNYSNSSVNQLNTCSRER